MAFTLLVSPPTPRANDRARAANRQQLPLVESPVPASVSALSPVWPELARDGQRIEKRGCEPRAEKRMWLPNRPLLFATFRACDADG